MMKIKIEEYDNFTSIFCNMVEKPLQTPMKIRTLMYSNGELEMKNQRQEKIDIDDIDC